MAKKDGVGYGDQTQTKIEHLTKILGMHLKVTQAVLNKHRYFQSTYRYVEVTAGKGKSPDGLILGSPLVFLALAETLGETLLYRADFIECNQCNIKELEQNIHTYAQKNGWKIQEVYLHPGEYQQVIPKLFPCENPKEFGLVFVDPSGEMPDLETIRYIARMRPKMEILLYTPAGNIKRLFPHSGVYLSDMMKEIGKTNWLIRRSRRGDKKQWTFLLGSNTDIFKDYESIGFYRLDSPEAQKFFPKLNLSKKQFQDLIQPKLF